MNPPATKPTAQICHELESIMATDSDMGKNKNTTTAALRQWLADKREQLKQNFLRSGNTTQLLEQHTLAIDQLIIALLKAYSEGTSLPLVIVATGGYGRKEQFPYSDIDLLFLHDAKNSKTAGTVAEKILYTLWDLGLTVGQAHRSVEDTIRLSHDDLTIRTNLLDARFIGGDKRIFDEFLTRFNNDIQSQPTLAFVEAKLAERDARHARFGDSRYMLEPNVKEGKGGLRDLHTLWWLARYAYPIHTLKDLVGMNLLTDEEYQPIHQAGQFLCKVRAHLHYLAGRAEERLTFDRQHDLASAMGFHHPSSNQAVERFMRRYFVAVRRMGIATRIICSLLEEQNKRSPHKALASFWHAPWKLGPFRLEGERLAVRDPDAFAQSPVLMLDIFRTAQLHKLDIHPHTLQLITRQLPAIDQSLQQDPKACALFMDILLNKTDAEVTLRKMSEAGVLGRFIRDFGRVVGQTQFNMYHIYTVDEHTLVAIGILHQIENGAFKNALPLATELIRRVKMRRVLFLALFCHDIAKGRPGDHSDLGEKIVIKLAKRFGFSADEIETAAWLVKYHLLLSNTSLKRDLNDPKTIQDFVAMAQTSERLKLLYVLTVADIRAVSPTVWNAWKAALLDELYILAEQAIGTGKTELKTHQTRALRNQLQSQLPGWSEPNIEDYLNLGNSVFYAGCTPPQHAFIARTLRESEHSASPLFIHPEHDHERKITVIIVITPDQNGLFSMLTGALSLAGANIIAAKIFTLKNGMAVDIFQVQDAAGDTFDRPDKLAKLSVYIEQALTGTLNLAAEISDRKRKPTQKRNAALASPGQVFVDNNASNMHTVIELTGQDRTGFLYQVTKALGELGLSIVTAHITTYGTQVADVFYVKDIFGMKISHEGKLKQIREKLLGVVSGT